MDQRQIIDEWGTFVTIPKSFTAASKSLTDKARWLFVLLREYTNGESGKAFPSYDTIRERTGWGRSQISNAIKDLEKHGWLIKTPQFGGVNLYTLVNPMVANSPKVKLLEDSSNNPKLGLQSSQTETPIVPGWDAIKNETTNTEITKNYIYDKPKLVRVMGKEKSAKSRTKKTVQVSPVESVKGASSEISPTTERVFCEECGNGMPGADNSIPDHLRGVREAWCKICDQPIPANSHTALDAVNGQLRVYSPSVEITGITASTNPVDPSSTPVSAKSPTTSRKGKTLKTDSPEEIQRKAAHKELMNYLALRTNQPILNGAAQGAAIKRILASYTLDQAKEVLDYQLHPATNWRGSVSWLSVQNHIADYFRRKQQQSNFGGNATDGNNLSHFITSYQTNGQRRKPGQRFLD